MMNDEIPAPPPIAVLHSTYVIHMPLPSMFNLVDSSWLVHPRHGKPVPDRDVCSRDHDEVASKEGIFHDALAGPVGSDFAAN